MKCPICEKEIKDSSKFCEKCGSKIPRCPTCGKVIFKKMRFCIYDGTPLPEEIVALLPEVSKTVQVTEQKKDMIIEDAPKKESKITKSKEEKKKTKKKRSIVPVLVGIIIVLVLLLFGTVGYMVISGKFIDFNLGMDVNNNQEQEESNEKVEEQNKENIDESNDFESDGVKENNNSTEESGDESVEDEKENNEEILDDTPNVDEELENPNTEESPIGELENQETEDEESDEIENVISNDEVADFILYCDTKLFSEEDIESFDADMCRIARNGIYARCGRKFKDVKLTEYFEQFDWYNQTINPEDFSEDMLNAYQVANRDLIIAYEQQQGYN